MIYYDEPKIFHEEGKLNLATFSLCELSIKNYDKLKFLCKIWGMKSVFEHYDFLKYKNEIVVRLRAKMRREDNRRKLYKRNNKLNRIN